MNRIINWVVVGICALVAVAWKFDIRQIIQIDPNYPAMQMNTAISLSLVALTFITRKKWLLILPCILSLVTLSEYIFEIDTGIGFTSIVLNAYPRSLGSFLILSRISGRIFRPARAP
jgi:hypothetical protein